MAAEEEAGFEERNELSLSPTKQAKLGGGEVSKKEAQRYIGGTLAFAFAALWTTAGLGSAVVCIVAGALGYGAVLAAQGTRFGGIAEITARLRNHLQTRPAPTPRSPRPSPQNARSHTRDARPATEAAQPATYGW